MKQFQAYSVNNNSVVLCAVYPFVEGLYPEPAGLYAIRRDGENCIKKLRDELAKKTAHT